MWKRVALALTIVVLVVNFFQPVLTGFPHRGAAWVAPWPMQPVQAATRVAYITAEDYIRWFSAALVGILMRTFLENAQRTLDLVTEIVRGRDR